MHECQSRSILYGTLLVFLSSPSAFADNEDIIAKCARIATVGDRILCLEDALRQPPPSTEPAPVEPDARLTVPVVPAEQPAAVTSVAETSPDAVEDVSMPAELAPAVPAAQPAVAVVTSAAETPADAVEDASMPDPNFGLKEKRPEEPKDGVRATVISVRKNLTNKFVFETEDGQMWIQTDQRNVRYEDVPFVARIRSASMGSFFLKPESNGVSVRVRREK